MPYLGLDPSPECLIPLIEKIESDAKSLTAGLSPAALNWRPPDGGWSVAQVLEHVSIGNRLYEPVMRRLLEQAGRATQGAVPSWKPSFFGRMLIGMLVPTSERKVRTSGRLKPGPDVGPDALAGFLATYRELRDLVWKGKGLDLNRMRMTSPVLSLVRRLNYGDGLVIGVVHGQRHLKQIERVKASPGFPAAAPTSGSRQRA